MEKAKNPENACFLLKWNCDFFKKSVLFPFEMGKGRKLAFLKNFPLYLFLLQRKQEVRDRFKFCVNSKN